MGWFDILNGNYFLQVANSRDSIIAELQEKIEKANKDKSWLSFKAIDYKKIILVDSSVTINRVPGMLNPYRGLGTITIKLDVNDKNTLINAKVVPYGEMKEPIIWFGLIGLTLFSAFIAWIIPGSDKYLFLAFIWLIFWTPLFLGLSYYRYRLKVYLKMLFEDLNLKGEFKSVSR